MAANLAANPGLTAGEVRDCINFTAKDLGDAGFDRTYGNGRIQVEPAVACDVGGGDPPPDPDPPSCGVNKDACSSDADCCSGNCGRKFTCRGN